MYIPHLLSSLGILIYLLNVLQALSQVLDMFPFYFGIRLAVLASKKEIMDLESWLSTQSVSSKDAFYEVSVFSF